MGTNEPENYAPHAAASSPANASRVIPHKRAVWRWRWLAFLISFLVVFYGVVGYWGSGLMIGEHPRWRGMNRAPRDVGIQGEAVSFPSLDGVPLKAWWLPSEGAARATVIMAHGIDHTRQVMLCRADFLVRGGYNALAVDLRGHGESGGQFVSPGLVEKRDLLGAIQFVRSRGERGPIALLGISYGAVACLFCAAESTEVGAVVADGAFPAGKDVFQNVSGYYLHNSSMSPLSRSVFATASFPGVVPAIVLVYYLRTGIYLGLDFVSVLPAASRITCPVLLISGERDWIVPTTDARRILAALPGAEKQLVTIPDAFHDTTYDTAPVLYQQVVLDFLNSNFTQR
jgi:pimeloyl-ACP methyl ester carboxylesterase